MTHHIQPFPAIRFEKNSVYFLIGTLYCEIVFTLRSLHDNTFNRRNGYGSAIKCHPHRSSHSTQRRYFSSYLNHAFLPAHSMEQALEKLGFFSMDDVNPEALKRAFKTAVINSHPDKGGSEKDFESILAAYVYLSTTIKRMTGGRSGFQVLNIFDVRQARDDQFTNELNNLVSEVFDHLDSNQNEEFRKEFNDQFEKIHVRENARGYEEWLKEDAPIEDDVKEELPNEDPVHWNRAFETTVKRGKPEPTTLILHPDQMGFVSGSTRGAALIPSDGHSFTSDPEERPEYTDLHAAYTSENTVYDKVPVYQEKQRTFEDILKERDMVYQSELDRDLEAIAAYEKRKQEEEAAHKQKIEAYFKGTASSVWALRNTHSIQREQKEDSNQDESFVKEFK